MLRLRNFPLALLVALIIGCSNSNDEVENAPPRDFEVVAVKSDFKSFTFRWTESTDPENSIVKYDIYLAENTEGAEFELFAENLSEQLVADKEVITVNGEEIVLDPPENPEFRFAYVATGLTHNTKYKGKVVAYDQEGNTTESFFWTTTLTDNVAPVIANFRQSNTYRYNSKIAFTIDDNEGLLGNWKLYLNGALHSSNEFEDPYGQSHQRFVYYVEDLAENTAYDAMIIVTDSNGNDSQPLEFSFTTTGATYVGDLNFIELPQSEINFFDDNQYSAIEGNIFLWNLGLSQNSFNNIQVVNGDISLNNVNVSSSNTGILVFPNLTELNGNLSLHEVNTSNLFNSLSTISGMLRMSRCQQNENDSPMLENLQSVSDLEITEGYNINSDSFGSLNTINGSLRVLFMYSSFQNLDFLSNLSVISNGLEIFDNNSLDDFCGIQNVINSGGLNGPYSVNENAYNPSLSDIINGDCSQ